MSATAEKSRTKPQARVAARDLKGVLAHARSAKAEIVAVSPKDRTVRFDTPTLAAVLPFAGTKGTGRALKVKRRDLAHVVRNVGGGDVLLGEADGRLRIAAARATVALPEAHVDPDPLTKEHPFDGAHAFRLEARSLARTLLRTAPFASRDETRPSLTTIALDRGRQKAIATDSYRLAVIDAPELPRARKSMPLLLLNIRGAVPLATALATVGGAVDVTLGEKHATFAFGDQRWSVATEVGRFPNYATLVPDEWSATVELNASELADAAALIAGLSIRNAPAVLTFTARDTATLAVADHPDVPHCSVSLSAKIEHDGRGKGTLDPIGLNPKFLLDAAKALAPEDITLSLIAPLRPVCLRGADSMHMVMPIRLNVPVNATSDKTTLRRPYGPMGEE